MTENISSRFRKITVRGWEPLGNFCKTTTARNQAEPYKSIEGGQGSWVGSWGYHYLTLNLLQKRSAAYWCQWSDDWSSYDYVSFVGMKVLIPADQFHSWMIAFDAFLQTKQGLPLLEQKANEEEWIHPGILINNPKTHMILPQNYRHKNKFYKIWVRPPAGWKGYERFPEAMNYIFVHWVWTVFSLNQGMFDVCKCSSAVGSCEATPWWALNGNYDKWINRSKYENCESSKSQNWGPFLQPKNCSEAEFSPFFLYKAYFRFRGTSIWRPLPHIFARDGLVPPAPGRTQSSSTKAHKKRPLDTADILPGDLDSEGFLTEAALERITGTHHRSKRRRLEDQKQQRLKHIANKLRLILNHH